MLEELGIGAVEAVDDCDVLWIDCLFIITCDGTVSSLIETVGRESVSDVDNAFKSSLSLIFVFLISITIFSNVYEDIGLHLDRPDEKPSVIDLLGGDLGIGIERVALVVSSAFPSSTDATESTLVDSAGACFFDKKEGLVVCALPVGVSGNFGFESQQNVSLFHNLQLRFSSLLPSSIESAHLLNTVFPIVLEM